MVGYSMGSEALSSDAVADGGINLTIEALKQPIFSLTKHPVFFEARFDLFYTDIGGSNAMEGFLSSQLGLAITGPLAMTVGFNGYGYAANGQELALSSDLSLGLQLSLARHLQHF